MHNKIGCPSGSCVASTEPGLRRKVARRWARPAPSQNPGAGADTVGRSGWARTARRSADSRCRNAGALRPKTERISAVLRSALTKAATVRKDRGSDAINCGCQAHRPRSDAGCSVACSRRRRRACPRARKAARLRTTPRSHARREGEAQSSNPRDRAISSASWTRSLASTADPEQRRATRKSSG